MKIGILTSGGDCQALNAAMRGVVKSITNAKKDVEIFGFIDGYRGLIYGNYVMLTSKDFSGILTQFLVVHVHLLRLFKILMRMVWIKFRE